MNAKVIIEKIHPLARIPTYATSGAAGADLSARVDETVVIGPSERKLIPTGLRIELPHGFEAQVRPRSGLALRAGVTILNSPGTIDSDYRGELAVILINLDSEPFVVKDGDRIAQLVVSPVVQAIFSEGSDLSASDRGHGGFGSTGR